MIENAVLLDTSIAVYALGTDHPLKAPCRAFLELTASGTLRGYASVEMIQELVHHRLRRTGSRSISAQDGRDMCSAATLLTFDREVLDLSMDLIDRYPGVRGRDAVHVATALAYGIDKIASTDKGFDGIAGVIRIDPRDVA